MNPDEMIRLKRRLDEITLRGKWYSLEPLSEILRVPVADILEIVRAYQSYDFRTDHTIRRT